MLKKFFVAAMMTIFFAAENFCAAMPASEMFLGGFTVGSSYADMVNMYGQLSDREVDLGHMASCGYGDSVDVGYIGGWGYIQIIRVSANNGWKTPSGLSVGDNISKALDICGEPDYKKIGAYKTAYCYVHRNGNTMDYGFFILFNKESGKILQLELHGGERGMANFEDIYQHIMKNMVE